MDEKRTEPLHKEKLEKMFKTWLSPPGVKFKNPEAEKVRHIELSSVSDFNKTFTQAMYLGQYRM